MLSNELIEAISRNDAQEVLQLLRQGADANSMHADGYSALGIALMGVSLPVWNYYHGRPDPDGRIARFMQNHRAILQALLEHGADAAGEDKDYGTILSWASSIGDQEAIRLLLANGADPNWRTPEGYGPFSAAAYMGEKEAAALLKQAGGKMTLQEAVRLEDEAEVALLLAQGVDVNAADYDDRTALDYVRPTNHALIERLMRAGAKMSLFNAVRFDDHAAVIALLNEGADINIALPYFKQTPLMWAAEAGLTSMVELLIERGANLDLQDYDDYSALRWAKARGHEDVYVLLKQAGAQMTLYDAISWNDVDAVRKYIGMGVDLTTEEEDYLRGAAVQKNREIIDLLLAAGARMSIQAAVLLGDTGTVERFLDTDDDVNMRDSDGGTTLLMLAAMHGQNEVAQLLLHRGADLHLEDGYAMRTALWYAEYNSHAQIAEMLREAVVQN